MNTINASPYGTNKETAKNPLDVRIILAMLWVAGMLSSLNGDTYRLNDPVVLKSPVSRWTNRILGIFYALAHLAFWALTLVNLSAGRVGIYEIVWYTAQLVLSWLVVWYAWKWPNVEA